MAPRGFRFALGAALLAGTVIVACGGDDGDAGPFDDPDAAIDSGARRETGPNDPGPDATGDASDSGRRDARVDADADAETRDAGIDVVGLPSGTIIDLAATPESHVSATLTWTSPPGNTLAYEIRYASTPITNEAEFLAATIATTSAPVAPLPTGSLQTATVTGLTPETTYHFVVRVDNADAGDDAGADAGGPGPLSNDAVVTTSGRARLLVSEIALGNTSTEGGDFIELLATTAGSVAGLEVFLHYDSPAVHKFAALDVAVGDRIVIHASGLPGPTNFVQEDETRDKASSTAVNASAEAYDVYSAVNDLPVAAAVTVMDGDAYQDVVPYSTRHNLAGDDHFVEYVGTFYATAFASLAGEWPLLKEPLEYEDRCEFVRELVNASGNESPDCGGFPGFVVPGWSIQRNGTVDTNTPADFVVAPQTRGAANAPHCPAETAKLVIREVNPHANLLELNVLEGGRLRAFDLRTNPQDQTGAGAGANLITLPDACVATGDVIVVHLGTNGTPSETTAKDQHAKATYAAYYDGAWDFVTPNTLTFASSVVVALRNPANAFVDVAAFSDRTTTTTGDYVASLRYVQGSGLWLPADCGGAPCGGATTPTAREVAVDWSSVDATAGTSVARTGTDVPSQASAWSAGAASFGQ